MVDAVVPDDYALPSAAFTAGHKSVFVRAGTYVESANIDIPDNGRLIGENTDAIIDLSSGAGYKVFINGEARVTLTGTFSVTEGSAAVTGSGTTFTSLQSGDYIKIRNLFYPIDSITDNTNLTLKKTYYGKTESGLAMRGQSMRHDIKIEHITLKDGDTFCLDVENLTDGIFTDVHFSGGAQPIEINDSGSITFRSCVISDSTATGAKVLDSITTTFIKCFISNNSANGIEINNNSENISFKDCEILNNGNNGFNIFNTTGMIVNVCTMHGNGNRGGLFDITATNVTITNCDIQENSGAGLRIQATDSIVNSNIIANNGNDGIDINNGDNVFVDGNIIKDNNSEGIVIASGGDNNTIGTNIFSGNLKDIKDEGTNTRYPGHIRGKANNPGRFDDFRDSDRNNWAVQTSGGSVNENEDDTAGSTGTVRVGINGGVAGDRAIVRRKAGQTPAVLLGTGKYKWEMKFTTGNTVPGSGEDFQIIVGLSTLHNGISIDEGVYFRCYWTGSALETQTVTESGGTQTTTTITNWTTNTSYIVGAEVNAAGTSVEFFVNGTVVATHTTNIETTEKIDMQMNLYANGTYTAASRDFWLDYAWDEMELTTGRI
jgi:parallel beta-helix repeat protein